MLLVGLNRIYSKYRSSSSSSPFYIALNQKMPHFPFLKAPPFTSPPRQDPRLPQLLLVNLPPSRHRQQAMRDTPTVRRIFHRVVEFPLLLSKKQTGEAYNACAIIKSGGALQQNYSTVLPLPPRLPLLLWLAPLVVLVSCKTGPVFRKLYRRLPRYIAITMLQSFSEAPFSSLEDFCTILSTKFT